MISIVLLNTKTQPLLFILLHLHSNTLTIVYYFKTIFPTKSLKPLSIHTQTLHFLLHLPLQSLPSRLHASSRPPYPPPQNKIRVHPLKIQYNINSTPMSFSPSAKRPRSSPSSKGIAIPLDNILRLLALQPPLGQQFLPHTWPALHVRRALEVDLQTSQQLNVQYQLQHRAFAVFDNASKKWRIEGEGDETALKTVGVVASKKHGARGIQLPNRTHKIVAGIVNAEKILDAFAAPTLTSDGKKVTLTPLEDSNIPFTAVSPKQYKQKSKIDNKSQYKHMEYVLHSSNKQTHEVRESNLTWSDSPHKTLTLVNGSDVEDLSRYKNILTSLRSEFLEESHNTQLDDHKRETLEKRLFLLEHEIDGLLKRKINYTSKDAEGNRFLDYTVMLNEKENEIISLHKKIENLQTRLKEKKGQESHLKAEIERLSEVVRSVQNPQLTRQDIDNLLLSQFQTINLHKKTQKLHSATSATQHLLRSHLSDLQLKGVKTDSSAQLTALVDQSSDVNVKLDNGIVHIVQTKDKIVEVPLQDAKTKELIKQMGIELNRIYSRYPKVKEEADAQFIQLLNKQVLHVVDADGLSKITQIIKYVPSLVKVENVYSYNNDRQRKVEFHLRVLLKALLTEFEKMKEKTGVTPEIDENVVKMIHEEIGDTSIDDILKVFQVNQKIVEVPKIVQKIVERIIEVPTIVPIEKVVEKIVENTKIEEVEKIVHVPIEIIKYVDKIVQKIVEVEKIKEKIVEVPRIIEKIVEKRVEVPKIVEVEVVKEKIVEVEKPVIIEKIVNHAVPEIREIEVARQQTVVVKEVEEKIKEVERIVEKIVERIVEKPVIIEVERIVEKLVNTVNYKPARQVVNHIEHVPQIVERVVEKVIPIIQTVEKIKEVTKIVEKIVEVRVQVPTVKEIKVIEEKIVYQDRVKEVEKTIEKIVPLIQEVIKEVERKVEVPIIQEKIVTAIEYVEKVIPERWETIKVVEIQKIVEKLVEVSKLIEVQKPIFKYITVEKPVKVVVQSIVEVPKIIEKIKEVRVPVDKIIEKLVEVPKVVQVQKIVEKIVVVPRIIEKIVEVPQIIEKIVDRIVEVEKIKEVIKEVKIPIIQEKIVEIEIIKNIEVPVYREIEVIREKIVPAIEHKEVIKTVDVVREKVVQSRIQIPKEVTKQKIVPHTVEIQKIVEVEKAIVIPFQLPVPCDKVIEKLVLVEKEVEKVVEVPIEVERIVQVVKEVATVKEITKIEEKPVIQEKIKEIEKIVPYITEKVHEVEVIKEKPVLAAQVEERIKEVAAIQEKIVQVVHQVPKIYEVEKVVEKTVQVPRFIEITAKEPVIITNNKIVDRLVDKVVQVLLIEQQIVSVPTIEEKIVTIEKIVQEIKEIYLNNDKIVEHQRLVNKTNIENKIETKFETVDRIEEKLVPVSNSFEKIVEVPHLIEKVVERIVLMPQVHQVTQHIIDIQEEASPGVAVDVDFREHEAKYNKLYSNLKKDTKSLVSQLRAMKKAHPQLGEKLQSIESYIAQLDEITAFPKIVQVTKDRIVNKDVAVPVILPKKTTQSIRNEAFYLVMIEKLIRQLKSAKANNSYNISDEEIKLLFLNSVAKEDDKKLKEKIDEFKHSPQGQKYSKTNESLLSEVLYDKFYLASLLEKSKLETERYRRISDERLELLHRFKQTNDVLHQRLLSLQETLKALIKKDNSTLNKETLERLKGIELQLEHMDELLYTDIKNTKIAEPVQSIAKVPATDINFRLQESRIRELQAEIELLRREYIDKAGSIIKQGETSDKDRLIDSLRKTITNLAAEGKGTKTTLGGDDERRDTITSLDKLGDNKGTKRPLKNETSIIGFIANSPNKNAQNDWDEFPIIKEEDPEQSENFGYIILPHGRLEKDGKSYKVIQNKENDSYIILPVSQSETHLKQTEAELKKEQAKVKRAQSKGKSEEDVQNYPYGNPWLPYSPDNTEQIYAHAAQNLAAHIQQQTEIQSSKSGVKQAESSSPQTLALKTPRKGPEGGSSALKGSQQRPSSKEGKEWIDPKNSQASPGKNGSNSQVSSKKISGEWVDPRTSQQKSSKNEWVDPKNAPKPTGEWISPKSIYATSNVTGDKADPAHTQPVQVSAQAHNRPGVSTLNIDASSIHPHPGYNVVTQPQYTIIQPNLDHAHSNQLVQFNYQQPGTLIIPNFFTPNNIPNLPGTTSKITYIDEHGHPIQAYSQNGQLQGDAGNGATYTATYEYKQEVKEQGSGQHKIEKKITEIRTNQTVNWISRSRVLEDNRGESPRKEDSPFKDSVVTPKK